MDSLQVIWQRANHVATEVAHYNLMKKFGEIRSRPSDEEVSEAMYDLTALFANLTRHAAGDPEEPSEKSVRMMTDYIMGRASKAIRDSSHIHSGKAF